MFTYPIFSGAANPNASLLDGLVSWWTFDEASGNRADSHGSNTLIQSGTVPSTTGLHGNGIDALPSSANYLSCARTDFVGGNRDWTLVFWLNNAAAIDQVFASCGNWGASNMDWYVFLENADQKIYFFTSNGSVYSQVVTSTLVGPGWNMIIVWHDSSAGSINVQKNTVVSTNSSINTPTSQGKGSFLVGKASLGFENKSNMDEMAFWSRVLSSDERTLLYNAGAGLTYSDLS